MLPFLKNKMEGSVSAPVETVKREPDQEQELDSLDECAKEILEAVKKGDSALLKESLKAFFEIADSEPHEEGPHNG